MRFPSIRHYIVSVNSPSVSNNVKFRPDVFKTAMFNIVDDFNPPSHGIGGNGKRRVFESLHQRTKLFRFPGFNLRLAPKLYRISSPKAFDFPLLTIRYANGGRRQIDTPVLFPLRDLWRDDHACPSNVPRCQSRSQCKCFGSCRPLALAFRL
ncbi:hypothetical protein BDM02DRAFT_1746163 [Thelephora ganbajun]|uniref:Uncharacterized protein n=1 Tax=Thelephora ganbajun TaxID=370292 RepID=A0ACB6ZK32_THEGA|nr:hypothetical protein BDM02DRAFT_1746163 [Thelephora ganbajun]